MTPADIVIIVLCAATLAAIVWRSVRRHRITKAVGGCPSCDGCPGCMGEQHAQRATSPGCAAMAQKPADK